MSSALRKHITPATILAFVALVFAITGGAFAASGNGGGSPAKASSSTAHATLTASAAKSKAKPKAKAGPRGPAGPKGATGAPGPAGPAGPAGATGPGGAPGPQGPAGATGATGAAGATGPAGPAGPKGTNGINGAIHPGETLPSGASETGVWFAEDASGASRSPAVISFPIPLAVELTWGEGIPGEPENQVHYINPKGEEVPTGGKEVPSSACTGSAAAPTAAPGNLCIYAHKAPTEGESGTNEGIRNPTGGKTFNLGAATSGALLEGAVGGTSFGTWAVTAP